MALIAESEPFASLTVYVICQFLKHETGFFSVMIED